MPPMPSMPAILGLACYKCFKQENLRLSRCSGCRRISYCSTGSSTIFAVRCGRDLWEKSQSARGSESGARSFFVTHEPYQADWKVHKPMCQALSAIETSNLVEAATLLYLIPNKPTTDVKVLNDIIGMQVENILSLLQRYLERYWLCFVFVSMLTFQREVGLFEIILVSYEPRCMVWYVILTHPLALLTLFPVVARARTS